MAGPRLGIGWPVDISAMIGASVLSHHTGHGKAAIRMEAARLDTQSPVSKSHWKYYKDITSMHTRMRQRVWTIAFCTALAAAGCTASTPAPPEPTPAATAAPPLPSGTLGANLVTATARVTAIDLQTRHVTLE